MRETGSKLATATRTLKGELLEGDEFQKLSLRVKPLNFEGRIQAFIERGLAEFVSCDCVPERIHVEGHLMISLDAVAALCQLEPDSFARQLRTKGYRCFPRKPGCHPQFFRKVEPDPSDAPQRLAQLTAAYQLVANEMEQMKTRLTVLEETLHAVLATLQPPRDRTTFVPAGAIPRMAQGQAHGQNSAQQVSQATNQAMLQAAQQVQGQQVMQQQSAAPAQMSPQAPPHQQVMMHPMGGAAGSPASAAAAAAVQGMKQEGAGMAGGLHMDATAQPPAKRARSEDGDDASGAGGGAAQTS